MSLTIGVDIGGTKIAGGLVDEEGTILARARRDTPARSTTAIAEAIVEVAKELADGAAASGAVGNAPTDRGPGLNGTGLQSGAATGGTPYSTDGSGQPVEGSASGRTAGDTR